MSEKVISSLSGADLGSTVSVQNFNDIGFQGVLRGIEHYGAPRRTILHLEDGLGCYCEVYVAATSILTIA